MAYIFNKSAGDAAISFFTAKAGQFLSDIDKKRLKRISRAWNFYEGYHWEEFGDTDSPQVTVNYCKRYVDKLVSFEFGKGFIIKMLPAIEKIEGENSPLTFLNNVWDYNKKFEKAFELGQSKSVTGDGWIQVYFEPKYEDGKLNSAFDDPFNEYDKGKFKIIIHPSSICFPEYDDKDKDSLKSFTLMYLINVKKEGFLRSGKMETVLFRQVWTKDFITEYEDRNVTKRVANKYGIVPFKHIKNHPINGKAYGASDIDDMIPINMEINLKKSNMSEIIDYHSAPVTIIYGARSHNLQRGANKVWGGLPKDAKVENLKLDGELDAAQVYVTDLKKELLEVSGIPVGALGGELNISNTSAVALQISLMPILEIVQKKQELDKEGLAFINKLILKIALAENMLTIPEGVKEKDYYSNTIVFESVLPKDVMAELEQIDAERKMLLLTREEALERLGKDNIQSRINDIDKEFKEHPEFYEGVSPNKDGNDKKLNAGLSNSPVKKQETNSN